jgi:hypothetical protein
MFVRESRLTGALQVPYGRPRRAGSIAFGAALGVALMAGAALGQTAQPTGPSPSGSAPPSGAPGGYPPSTAAPATPSQTGTPPSGSQAPGSAQPSQPPPGAAVQPNYPPPSSAPQGYPPPPGYPPNYAQQGQPPTTQQPMYGQPPGYGGYTEPPLPPPPKRIELQWSLRFQLLNLLFGRVTGEVEYAFAGPFSLVILPEYVFNQPIDNRPDGLTAKGGGIAGEFGFWVEGRPLRGYFLKAHAGYRSITITGPLDEIAVPATEVGALFGSQSIYGGWFTLSGGFGVVYDFQSKERPFLLGYDSAGRRVGSIRASGLFGNGFDLLGQLSIGGSF